MDERKFKLKPLDIAAFLLYFGLTPLVLHSLPFFFSCAAEVLLLVAVVLVVGLNHRAEDQEERKRQEDENKKQWNQAMGGDNGPDSEQPDVIPRHNETSSGVARPKPWNVTGADASTSPFSVMARQPIGGSKWILKHLYSAT